MKKKAKKIILIVLSNLIAFFIWFSYKAKFRHYNFDGTTFNYERYLQPRWYSPFYWIYALVYLLVKVFDGGLLEGFVGLTNEYRTAKERNTESYENSFKPSVSWIRRRIILWRVIYFNY